MPLHEFAWQPAMERAGFQRDALYLVRPDGYVALATREQPAAMLAAYLDARLIRPNAFDAETAAFALIEHRELTNLYRRPGYQPD